MQIKDYKNYIKNIPDKLLDLEIRVAARFKAKDHLEIAQKEKETRENDQ